MGDSDRDDGGDGDVVGARAVDDSPLPSLDLPLPKRRLWPLVAVGLALLAVVAIVVWRQMTAAQPLRVLVAVEVDGHWWEGSKAAAQLADELSELLDNMGFESVRAGDPETAEVLEQSADVHEAAHALRAAFVVTGSIREERIDLPVEDGFVEVRLDGPVRVHHMDEDRPLAERDVHTFSGAKSHDRALGFAAESAGRHALDVALPAMLEHPSIADLLASNDPSVADRLAPAKNFAAGRKREFDGARAAYAEVEKNRVEQERGGNNPSFHSPLDANDRLLAVGPQGWLVTTARVDPFYSARDPQLLRSEHLETVEWRDASGGKTVLWRGYNAFTYPSLAPTGQPLVVVEDLFGWARTVAVITAGTAPKRVLVHATRRVSEPQVAPGGKAVALVERACVGCPTAIMVLDLDRGDEIWRLDAAQGRRIGSFAWLAAGELMVVFTPLTGEEGGAPAAHGLWAVDVQSGRARSLLLAEGGAILVDPAASADGRTVAICHANANALVLLNVRTGTVRSLPTGGRPSAPSFSPDGARIAFELTAEGGGGRAEVAVIEVDSGKVARLTHNTYSDRLPRFSADGGRVLFEARDADPVFGGRRPLVRIASVPAP